MSGWIIASVEGVAAAGEAGAGAQTASGIFAFLPMIVLLVVFWVVLYMPQRKQQKKRDEMLKNLKKGDKVVSIGGIYGEIVGINDEDATIKLKIADKTEITISKTAVGRANN